MIEARGTIGYVPEWWLRELKMIDERYSPVYNDDYNYFSIFLTVKYWYEKNGKYEKVEAKVPVATFTHLNDAALTDMRRRKEIGRKFERESNPVAYLDWIKRQAKEAKAKENEIAMEMQAEGLMKIHQAETKQGFFNSV